MNAIGKIGVVGLGYVGLPLAVAFARKYAVVGFDVSEGRIAALRQGVDFTNEVSAEELQRSNLVVTSAAEDEFGITLSELDAFSQLDVLIYAVSHEAYAAMGSQAIADMIAPGGILIDVKSSVARDQLPEGIRYWSL